MGSLKALATQKTEKFEERAKLEKYPQLKMGCYLDKIWILP